MSRFSQPRVSPPRVRQAPWASHGSFMVGTFPMSGSTQFRWHVHGDHQLAWASVGTLTVLTESATWVLPPTRALWIPAGVRHETRSAGRAMMRSVYVPPALAPVDWREPTVIAASPLLAEVIAYLTGELTADQRQHAETMLSDLLMPVSRPAVTVRFPQDGLAAEVARQLRDYPSDRRPLAEWGAVVGASERTLARAFVASTGLPFGQWRTLLRIQAALPRLAAGEAVSRVAVRVGYETPSAFVAAFRRETGVTPAAYFE